MSQTSFLVFTDLHADIMHLAQNLLCLFGVSDIFLASRSAVKYYLVYLGAGILGAAAELFVRYLLKDGTYALGASGAVMGVLGADMETAALFTIGRLRGMRTASILNNVVLWGADTADAIGGYVGGESLTAQGERLEILTALEAFVRLDGRKEA